MYCNNYCPNNSSNDVLSNSVSKSNARNQYVLAMAYVPWQDFESTYDLNTAFYTGTIFPELNKPFKGVCVCSK